MSSGRIWRISIYTVVKCKIKWSINLLPLFPASYDDDSLKQVNKQMWVEQDFTFVKLGSSSNASGVVSSPERKIQKRFKVIANNKMQIHQGYW